MTMTIQSVPVESITIDEELDFRSQGGDVTELAASIEAFGLMQPITIAPDSNGGYQVVAGRRRLRAYVELGRTEIDAIVREDLDDQAQVIGQIIENLQREDVSILDEARAFAQLGDYGMKQKDVAAACGVSPAHVSGRLALLKLDPATLKKVEEGKYPLATAVKLARLPKTVRDTIESKTPSEWEISNAERNHEEAKAIESLMKDIAEATGLPTGGKVPGQGYTPTNEMAEQAGLTDEHKPKSHDWDIAGRYHRTSYESDEQFLAALKDAGVKGFFVHSAGPHATVVLLDSANLDKARKAEQEEQRKRAEEQEAIAAKRMADFDASLAPMIDSPDKASVLAFLLTEAIEENLRGWQRLPQLLKACDRLGIEPPSTTDEDEIEAALQSFSQRNVTDAIRVLLALQNHVDDFLIHMGFVDTYPTEHLPQHLQIELVKTGRLDRERLTADAEEKLALLEQAEAEQEELDGAFEAEVKARVEAVLADPDVDTEGITDEELEAITSQVRDQVEAEFESGDIDLGGEGEEE